jgi:riboflavin kinase/FMN adenylyltransferase
MEQKRVIALGFFDGVHRGHGALLSRAAEVARERGARAAALSYDPHPLSVIPGARAVKLLNTTEDRERLMSRCYGIDEVMILPFDEHTRTMPWQDFVRQVLHRDCGAVHVVAGHDHHFGYKGEGDTEKLKALCSELGMGCDVIPAVEDGAAPISSSRVRALVAQGDMEEAARLLGHPHCLSGEVVPGKKLGRTLGIPTANLSLPPNVLPPALGVYAGRVKVGEQWHLAVTNVGVRPTVEDSGQINVEPWILDFEGNLYGQTITVEYHKFLRGEQRFASVEELRNAILRDAASTRTHFAHLGG